MGIMKKLDMKIRGRRKACPSPMAAKEAPAFHTVSDCCAGAEGHARRRLNALGVSMVNPSQPGIEISEIRGLPRNDHNAGGHLVAIILEVIFDPLGICNSSFRIIDHTKKSAACGVLLIFGNVDDKLLAELLRR